jgi:hypothetical protein
VRDRVKLLEVPLLKPGVAFDRGELDEKIEQFVAEIKIYIPQIDLLVCDLDCELLVSQDCLSLILFLIRKPQFILLHQNKSSLNNAAIEIVEHIQKLPQKMRLLAYQTFSISQTANDYLSDSDQRMMLLMKKHERQTLNLLLAGQPYSMTFPVMAPYVTDHNVRQIEFKIDYIHSEYFKIKLISDSVSDSKRSKTTFLKIEKKLVDDQFFLTCVQALRSKPKKLLMMDAFCFRDSITNHILLYHVAS